MRLPASARWLVLLSILGCGSGAGQVYPIGAAGSSGGAWSPPARCLLPFEAGPCEALIPVFAYVGGACVATTYGGCDGNENRFDSIETCLATCEGRPGSQPCPFGRVAREICLGCGFIGCREHGRFCAQPCSNDEECASQGQLCHEGVCDSFGCEGVASGSL